MRTIITTLTHTHLVGFSKDVPPFRVSQDDPLNVQVLQHGRANGNHIIICIMHVVYMMV